MSSKKKKASEVEVLTNNWIAVQSKSHSNRTYYFNTVTKKSSWKNPCKKSSSSGSTQAGSTGDSKKEKGKVEKLPKISSKKSKEADKLTNSHLQNLPSCTKDVISLPGKMVHSDNDSGQINLRNSERKVSFSIRTKSKDQSSLSNEHDKKDLCNRDRIKTAAQARLLIKRKEYEEQLKKGQAPFSLHSKKLGSSEKSQGELQNDKKLLSSKRKQPDFNVNTSDSVNNNVVKTKVTDVLKKRIKQDKRYQERIKTLSQTQTKQTPKEDNIIKIDDDDDSMCRDEKMDWEPVEQEIMIEHIKTLRKNLDTVNELSGDIEICSYKDIGGESESNKLVLVFDTNVFISCLQFIKDIQYTHIAGLGLPNIFIPWRVLQELDHLKNSSNKQLQLSAIKAIRYINNNFASRHPRVTGQSFEEFSSMRDNKVTSPDDEILLVCLKLKETNSSKTVILITNDKNLESKAIVSNVEAFSNDRFVMEKMSKSKSESCEGGNSSPRCSNLDSKEDTLYCKLNDLLKDCFAQLLEVELRNAFANDWRRLVKKKPPWTLSDIMECLIKHWRAVFSFVFKKDVLLLVEELKNHLQKLSQGHKSRVEEIIQVSKELLTAVMYQTCTEKSYREILEKTMLDVKKLQQHDGKIIPDHYENSGNEPQGRPFFMGASCSTIEPPNTGGAESCPTFNRQLCKEKVKSLFQMIWDQVRNLCSRISVLVANNGMNDEEAVNQIKWQFPAAIQKVQELVEISEKILSLGPGDTSQFNDIILHFAQFLVSLNVFQIEGSELNNFPMYIAMFCSDNEGRQVLCTLVNDLKQFGFEMVNGVKALGFV